MSSWTHITLTCEVSIEHYKSPEEVKAQVEARLKGMAGVTGSEADACIYVIPLSGSLISVSKEGGVVHYFNEALVVVHGHLRDRTKTETMSEVEDFITDLKGNFDYIRDLEYNVWEDDEPEWVKR